MNKSIIQCDSNVSNEYFAAYVIAKEVATKSTLKETAYLYQIPCQASTVEQNDFPICHSAFAFKFHTDLIGIVSNYKYYCSCTHTRLLMHRPWIKIQSIFLLVVTQKHLIVYQIIFLYVKKLNIQERYLKWALQIEKSSQKI